MQFDEDDEDSHRADIDLFCKRWGLDSLEVVDGIRVWDEKKGWSRYLGEGVSILLRRSFAHSLVVIDAEDVTEQSVMDRLVDASLDLRRTTAN